jgi:hypothetical protein
VTSARAYRDRPRAHRRVVVFVVAAAVVIAGTSLGASSAWAFRPWGWQHALRVVRELESAPPQAPLVLLLGGSCARESTVSDQSWAAAVSRRTGAAVDTYNLGSSNQTFEQEVALAKGLPKVPAVVFIALNRGRFTAIRTKTDSIAPASHAAGTYAQHLYSATSAESPKLKQKRVRVWVRMRYPQFERRYAANMALLDKLVRVCLRRGYHPVLLEMPRNTAVIGHAFDAALGRYQPAARRLAAHRGIPYLDFAERMRFATTDFYDNDHLVEPGRAKFQTRLSQETAGLLARYQLLPAAGAGAGRASASAPSGARPLAVWPFGVALVAGGVLVARRRSDCWQRREV